MSRSRGFTLIELLVVIAIIGLLSSIVLASLNTARQKGQDAARVSDIKSIETALELYYNDNGGYPTSNGSGNGDVVLSDATLSGELVPKYIGSMPALLVADGDHYYAYNYTTGVETAGYGLDVYVGASNSYCITGVNTNLSWWGGHAACNF